MKYQLLFLFIVLCLCSCKKSNNNSKYYTIPAEIGHSIQVVVEIPAGTNHKIGYNKTTQSFENDQIDGKNRVINFLPYPGNYGFIPSTYRDPARGGNGHALSVLVIGESQPTKTIMEVLPIGVLLLKDQGKLDSKIIAIPADSSLQIISVDNFSDFMIEYDAAKRIIEDWFLNYKGYGVMQLIGWRDEQYARQEVLKWKVKLQE